MRVQSFSAGLAMGNDYSLKRTMWKLQGQHDF